MSNAPKQFCRSCARARCALGLLGLLLLVGDASAGNFVVRMQGTRFVPRDITISVGDSITWTNLDVSGHDAVSGTNGVPSGFWQTPLFGFRGSATVVFTNIPPRSYGYYCTPHVFVGMVGSVTVLPANSPPVVSILEPTDGAVVPAGVPLVVTADALDSDGRVVRVDFSVDGSPLGSDSVGPFTATYPNPTPGIHGLRVVAVDDRGATSAPVSVTITALLPPSIVQQPQSTNGLERNPVSFSVVATGAPPLEFQWQFNGADIPAATNVTYTIASVTTNDGGNYAVVVRNPAASVTSANATLAVTTNKLPAVTLVSPTNGQFAAHGANLSLLANATDTDGAITRVEFLNNGHVVANVTNEPYAAVLANLQGEQQYRIAARATDDRSGATESAGATVNVLFPPTVSITAPLPEESFPLGATVTIETATGASRFPVVVEHLVDEVMLGVTNQFTPPATGYYVLRATVTDLAGQRTTSAPVSFRVYLPESVPPSIAITSAPPNFTRLSSPVITLAGTASDDVGVLRVEVENQTAGITQPADGTERWRTELVLVPGMNTVRVRSMDQAFNPSPWVTRYFKYVVNASLAVRTDGQGSVSPNLNGRLLELGKTYRLTAKPGRGQIFGGWTGAPSQGAVLDFVMQSNLTLTASFIPSPFWSVAGSYAGLITDTNTFALAGNGLLTLQVTESGSFSGRLRTAGRNLGFRGFFDNGGFGHASALRPSLTPIVLAMQLDLSGNDGGVLSGSATDGSWVADLLAYRNPYATGTNLCPRAGTLAFAWMDEGFTTVAASGLKISTRGKASATATFADGRRASVSSSISFTGAVPVSFSASGKDTLLGWAVVGLTGDPVVRGGGWLIPAGTNRAPSALDIR